jgi:hypothetical protein
MNTDLHQFVRDALQRGTPRERIRELLRDARWRTEEIDTALAAWADGEAGLPVPRRRVSLSAREAFLHLVMFATLYIFTFDAGAILFAIIEWRLRDPAVDGALGALPVIRWALAGVITALPIFLWTTHVADRAIEREPEKRQSAVRRWLTYLTLFVAALVLIGNFNTIVSGALSGELGGRTLLKCLVVFAIAGAVFGHYLLGSRREEAEAETPARRVRWIGRLGLAGTVLTVVAGLVLSGAPSHSRVRELDARRLDALRQLGESVDVYYDRSGRLPHSLDDVMTVPGVTFASVRDPETHARFGYQRVDSLRYRLAATFAGADTLRPDGSVIEERWRHGRGQVWFDRAAFPNRPGYAGPGAYPPPARRPAGR